MEIKGKAAVVTGAARGIGRAIADALADAGARVVLADLGRRGGGQGTGWDYKLASADDLELAAQAIRRRGGQAITTDVDVSDAESCKRMVAAACDAFDGIDVLVNNAGLVKMGFVANYPEADWDRLFAVNTKGVFLCTQAALPALSAARGTVINVASIAGKRGYPGLAAYCASKFAVVGLTQAMAAELGGSGIRVNAVCPGLLATAMWTDHLAPIVAQMSGKAGARAAFDDYVRGSTPLGREQKPEDVADAVLYLARADNVTGIALNVAGGAEMG
jgi:meso-butanediol dehydrogenase/(S,S)-butanediol dehydrogenase/diacetyl reductase